MPLTHLLQLILHIALAVPCDFSELIDNRLSVGGACEAAVAVGCERRKPVENVGMVDNLENRTRHQVGQREGVADQIVGRAERGSKLSQPGFDGLKHNGTPPRFNTFIVCDEIHLAEVRQRAWMAYSVKATNAARSHQPWHPPRTMTPYTSPDYAAPLPVNTHGVDSRAELKDFCFESGERLDRLTIGYTTHGTLNAARDNAILLMPGTANTRHSADGYIGAASAFDTDKYFVVASDGIGAGTSSRPSEGLRGAFPRYTVRDMVNAQHRLVTEVLALKSLKAVAGASMGAFQALEWAIHYPTTARAGILMVPAVVSGNIFRSIVASMIQIIKSDPLWRDGNYASPPRDGLRLAGQIYYPWTVADDFLQALSPDDLAREMNGTMERSASWDAWDLIRRYEASASHDIAVRFNGDLRAALAQVQMPLLIMPATTDRLLGVAGARLISRGVSNGSYREIESARGHLGWRPIPGSPEMETITRNTRAFLEEIAT